jgi:hypothetical protein
VKDAVILAYDALRKAVPDVRFAQASSSLSAWLALDGGPEAAQKLLHEHANAGVVFRGCGYQASRFTGGASGFLNFSQSFDRPER